MPTKKVIALIILTAGIALAILPFILKRPAATPSATLLQSTKNPDTKTGVAKTNETANDTKQSTPPVEKQFLHAKFTIDGRNYDLPFLDGEALYEAMSRLSKTGVITIEGHEFSGLGYFIDALNGKRAKIGYSWVYSINGVKSSLGVSNYKVRKNDSILWTYEKAY